MIENSGLIWAYDLLPDGTGRSIGWNDLDTSGAEGFRWIHFDRDAADVSRWLVDRSGLTGLQVEALLAEETRPRATPMGDGLLLILRGVNLNPGADPEEMVSVRLWAEEKRIITFQRRRMMALADIREQVDAGRGPTNVGDFVASLANRLVDRMAGVLGELDDSLDEIEAAKEPISTIQRRNQLLELRRQAITLRRHLSPQREALARLAAERMSWIGDRERLYLRESLDRTTRYVEDLESARERAAVTQEELANIMAEEMNRRMYALSIVAGIFLPLSFGTGLLGINVAGIPGSNTPSAFVAVCGMLTLIAVGEVLLFRRLRWL